MNLREYVDREGSTIPRFAKLIGYSAQHVYNVLHKVNKPSKRFIKAVDDATNGQVKEIDYLDKEVLKEDLEKSIEKFKEEHEFHG